MFRNLYVLCSKMESSSEDVKQINNERKKKEMLKLKKEVDRRRGIGFDLTFRRTYMFTGDLLP